MRLVGQALDQAAGQTRFANPSLAREQHQLTFPVLGPRPALQQDAQLMLAADQRREPLAVQRLEAAFGTTLPFDPPSGEGFVEALEALGAEIGELEQPAHQPSGRLADHNAARRGECLQSRGEARRLADHRLLLSRPLADQLADHDQAGGDPDPRRERSARRRLQTRQRIDNRKPRPDRPLGLVLVRRGPAEVRQHAVAHVLGDMPAPTFDHRRAAAMVGAEHLRHVLRVELRRQLGRADEVDEHYRQLPPLGITGKYCRGRLSSSEPVPDRRSIQRRDRLQQPLAVAEVKPEFPQIGIGKVAQHVGADAILGEGRRMMSEPLFREPAREVHKPAP
jgi:hypothetical protein